MNATEEELKEETELWLDRLRERIREKDGQVDQMENVTAYRDDTEHFLEEEEWINAYESVIYAWGILETLERLGKFEKPDTN